MGVSLWLHMWAAGCAGGAAPASDPRIPPPEEIERRFDQRVPHPWTDSIVDWEYYGPSRNWIASGVYPNPQSKVGFHDGWFTHPPIAFARDVVGDTAFDACVADLKAGRRQVCKFNAECFRMVVFVTGNIQVEWFHGCLQKQLQPESP